MEMEAASVQLQLRQFNCSYVSSAAAASVQLQPKVALRPWLSAQHLATFIKKLLETDAAL